MRAVQELQQQDGSQGGPIAHEPLLLGMAEALADILHTLPLDVQKEFLPRVLHTVVHGVSGASLVVVQTPELDA
jgi:hypothetical protein